MEYKLQCRKKAGVTSRLWNLQRAHWQWEIALHDKLLLVTPSMGCLMHNRNVPQLVRSRQMDSNRNTSLQTKVPWLICSDQRSQNWPMLVGQMYFFITAMSNFLTFKTNKCAGWSYVTLQVDSYFKRSASFCNWQCFPNIIFLNIFVNRIIWMSNQQETGKYWPKWGDGKVSEAKSGRRQDKTYTHKQDTQ